MKLERRDAEHAVLKKKLDDMLLGNGRFLAMQAVTPLHHVFAAEFRAFLEGQRSW